MWRTFKRGFNNVDNPELDIDDKNVAWSKNEVAEMLQVGDIAVINADVLVHFFICYMLLELCIPWIKTSVMIMGMFTT